MRFIERSKNRETYALEYICIIFTVLILGFIVFSFIPHYLGYATALNAEAGTITEIEIIDKRPTFMWAGLYGIAIRFPGVIEVPSITLTDGDIKRLDAFFDCIEDGVTGGNELFATTASEILWDELQPATTDMVDEYLNFTYQGGYYNKSDSANNTFTDTMTVFIGTREISNIPATYTFQNNAPSTVFDIGILNDSVNLVFVAHITDSPETPYSGNSSINYQMLLPVPENSTQEFFFFVDPYDVCPEGGVGNSFNVSLYGWAIDTSNNSLANVTVNVAGYSILTDENGFYNLSLVLMSGTYNMIARKDGYDPFFDNVTFTFQNTSQERNITLTESTPGLNETVRPIIYGYVKDSDGNAIAGANVSMDGVDNVSASDGYYWIQPTLSIGRHWIIATKEDYNNYVNNLTIYSNSTLIEHNITMETSNIYATGPYLTGPYATGPYTTEALEEVIVYPPVPPRVERPEGTEVFIPVREIKKKILQNTFIQESIPIFNFRGTPLTVTASISEGLKSVVVLDATSVTIPPDSWGNLPLTLYGNELGQYNGTITLGGDISQEIPVNIEVVENKYPIEVLLIRLALLNKIITPGNPLNYKVSLQNLLTDQRYKVNLEFVITDLNDSSVFLKEEDEVEIYTTANLLKEFLLPKDMEPGEYVLRVNAKYLNMASTISTRFKVSLPLYLYTILGVPLWIISLALSLLSSGTFSYSMYKRYKQKKKRYQFEVDKKTLPGPGPRSAFIGKLAETDIKAYMDLDRLTTHAIVAGSTGRGKSIAAQDIIEEALMKGVGVIVVDPTAQWSGMLRKCKDKKMMSFYPLFGMKPQDARAFNGNVRQINHAREVIEVKKYLKPGEIQIFSVNKLDPKDVDLFVANLIREVFHSDPQEERELKYMLVFDEVHRLLPRFGGSGEGFIQVERACREFRKWGIGIMLISQVLSDFVGAIKANINTEIQTRTADENDLKRISTKYGDWVLKSLVKARVGVAMVQNAAYNRGKPYFVHFRPILHNTTRLPDEELENYNKYNDIIDDLEYQIDQLEEEGIDVFDLRLELKLALDKVKSGNFNMVDIYLEGLTPRIASEWTKLGKKPKKRVVKLVDEKDLKAAVLQAKKAREKYEAEHKTEEKKEEKKEDIFKKVVKAFTFENGMMISSLQELNDIFEVLDEDLFNKQRQDIINWIKSVGFSDIAEKLSIAKTKDEMHKLLEDIKKNQDKKDSNEKDKDNTSESDEKKKNQENKKEESHPAEQQEQQQPLVLVNGTKINKLEELLESLKKMDENTLLKHFNKEKNDFADWVEKVCKVESLANKMRKVATKEEMIILLEMYLKERGTKENE